jgi:hypothetical protein
MPSENFDRKAYVLKSFECVGPKKAVGYLPLPAIKNFLNATVDSVKATYIERGLKCVEFSEDETCVNGGALFVYDEISFKKILDQFDIEVTPLEFIKIIAADWLDNDDPRMPVVRALYAD